MVLFNVEICWSLFRREKGKKARVTEMSTCVRIHRARETFVQA